MLRRLEDQAFLGAGGEKQKKAWHKRISFSYLSIFRLYHLKFEQSDTQVAFYADAFWTRHVIFLAEDDCVTNPQKLILGLQFLQMYSGTRTNPR